MTKAVQPQPFFRPALLAAAWTLRKGRRAARCTIWSHPSGFELRLLVCEDPLPRLKICRTHEEMTRQQATWRRALEAQGWVSQMLFRTPQSRFRAIKPSRLPVTR
jgi:hypothetical protein